MNLKPKRDQGNIDSESESGLNAARFGTKLAETSQPWVHKSEIGDRRVDVAAFIDWCLACGVEPLIAVLKIRQR